jgi:hypothetical protein
MYRMSIAIAAAAAMLLVACGSDNNNTQSQQQAVTGLCQALTTNCASGTSDDQNEGEDETACEDRMQKTTTTGAAARDSYDFPVSDSTKDDLTCRENEAKAAASATDAATKHQHCVNAGPTGGGVCGSLCDVYCDLEKRHCNGATSTNPAAPTNPGLGDVDHATCVAACNGAAFSKSGTPNVTKGDSIQCRIWHLGKAQANPTPHCFHTRLVSAVDNAGTTTGAPCSGAVQ